MECHQMDGINHQMQRFTGDNSTLPITTSYNDGYQSQPIESPPPNYYRPPYLIRNERNRLQRPLQMPEHLRTGSPHLYNPFAHHLSHHHHHGYHHSPYSECYVQQQQQRHHHHHQQQQSPQLSHNQQQSGPSYYDPLNESSYSGYMPSQAIDSMEVVDQKPTPQELAAHFQQNAAGVQQLNQPMSWYQPPALPPPQSQSSHSSGHMINMLQMSDRYAVEDQSSASLKVHNGREARNRAEKNRRDKLNGSIHELSTLVPHVAESPRRVDKTGILRFSAHSLRTLHVFGKTPKESESRVTPDASDALMRLLDCFLLTVTCRGVIVLVSTNVEHNLGHCQTDLLGQSMMNITHPDDHAFLKRQLVPTDVENLFDIQPDDDNGDQRTRTQEEEDNIDMKLRADKRNFTIRMARAGPRSEPTAYELVNINGSFRRADCAQRGVKTSTFPTGLPLLRRGRGRDDSLPILPSISGNDIVLVAMAHVVKPPSICDRLLEACKYEYRTRHLIDGRIVQCDQRISIVAGYMSDEVSGLSPFTFMHKEDVRWVMVALRQMYDNSNTYGESCYRLMTRNGKFVYLKTSGFLEVEDGRVQSFTCINSLVSEEEGRRLSREMKRKYAVIIDQLNATPMESDIPAVEDPAALEDAVIQLVRNLTKNDFEGTPVHHPQQAYLYQNNAIQSPQSCISDTDSDRGRNTVSPQLSLIVPELSTIKRSITESMVMVERGLKSATKVIPNNDRNIVRPSQSGSANSSSSLAANSNSKSCGDSMSLTSKLSNYSQYDNEYGHTMSESSHSSEYKDNFSIKSEPLSSPESVTGGCSSSGQYQVASSSTGYRDNEFYGSPTMMDSMSQLGPISSSTNNSLQRSQSRNISSEMSNRTDQVNRNSVLKRTITSVCDTDSGNHTKRRVIIETTSTITEPNSGYSLIPCLNDLADPSSDLAEVLPSSFDALDRSLMKMEEVADELREKYNTYGPLPESNQDLDQIIDEHQEQRQMLETIQNEFNSRIQNTTNLTETDRMLMLTENDDSYHVLSNSTLNPSALPQSGSQHSSSAAR